VQSQAAVCLSEFATGRGGLRVELHLAGCCAFFLSPILLAVVMVSVMTTLHQMHKRAGEKTDAGKHQQHMIAVVDEQAEAEQVGG
jgi:hypothetical protein